MDTREDSRVDKTDLFCTTAVDSVVRRALVAVFRNLEQSKVGPNRRLYVVGTMATGNFQPIVVTDIVEQNAELVRLEMVPAKIVVCHWDLPLIEIEVADLLAVVGVLVAVELVVGSFLNGKGSQDVEELASGMRGGRQSLLFLTQLRHSAQQAVDSEYSH